MNIVWRNVPLIPVTLIALAVRWWHWRVSQRACQIAIRYDNWMRARVDQAAAPEVPRG